MKKGLIGLLSACFLVACFSGTAMAAEAGSGQEGNPELASLASNEEGGQQEAQLESKAAADEPPSIEGTWEEDGGDWLYRLPDGTHLTRDWLYDKGHWYYFYSDGYMAKGNARIGGNYYYFHDTGEMAQGWAYDSEEDMWYYLEEDGVKKTGWLNSGGIWYWFNSRGEMYNEGYRMVSGHKYYFFSNGQLAADRYVGLHYYDSDGIRDRQYDIVVQGDRNPTKEEEEAITEAMENIPGKWIKKCVESGWEFMFYTDKNYFSAPSTDQGIYYVYHKTDINYKKIKFTKPESLPLAIGEYIAHETGNDKDENSFMADYQQYLAGGSLVQPLPSYFDDKAGMWFGSLFEAYIRPEVRYDMRWESPELIKFMETALDLSTEEAKPTMEELEDQLLEEYGIDAGGTGPSADEELGSREGPASA